MCDHRERNHNEAPCHIFVMEGRQRQTCDATDREDTNEVKGKCDEDKQRGGDTTEGP